MPCIEDAETRTASIDQLNVLLGGILEDVSNRVAANPAVLGARNRFEECIAGLGYDLVPVAGQSSDEQASEIMSQYMNGQISQVNALDELGKLRSLQEAEAFRQAEVESCAEPYALVQERISVEEQRDLLDQNGSPTRSVGE